MQARGNASAGMARQRAIANGQDRISDPTEKNGNENRSAGLLPGNRLE
ncbi:hypothetical protein [Pseudoduganella chitinolytica]|uniref:Uncharacterized protein n=1 Tax=Pseudoduganella chitinolytica TaxID=34070 RepID=A0ABY8BD50_9BURK|nr:hypothetical protein [Pseudoduganella chitinolytica]WEF33841.1 hypothetical protein PX653_03395 [Pseudoduganella chitinolytica]